MFFEEVRMIVRVLSSDSDKIKVTADHGGALQCSTSRTRRENCHEFKASLGHILSTRSAKVKIKTTCLPAA